MSLAEYSVKRPVTITMFFLGLILLGLIALYRIPQELFPPITLPEVTIVTNYFNAAPEEIETLVTKPLEEAVSSVSGLKSIQSTSREGKSIIRVGFDWGADVNFAALAVREKIDLVKEKLPRDAEEPVVVKFNPLARPTMILSLTGKPSLVELKELAVGTIKDVLEKAEGAASATVSGGLDREISVDVDQGRLYASGLSIMALVESLEKTNLSYPAGTIKKGLYEHLIRTIGEFETVEDVAFSVAGTDRSDRIYVPQGGFVERAKFGPRDTIESKRLEEEEERPKKRLILFKDAAEIKENIKEAESISRYNGKENVSISIQKQAGANSLAVVRAVREALKKVEEDLRLRETECEIIFDESAFIREAIGGVRNAALAGSVLAFLALLFSLRNVTTAVIVTLTIPVSIVGVFFLMFFRGISINIMSLGGLALGIGTIVDTSIVVIENIFRHQESGVDRKRAAVIGTEEVFWPIISSTLTTIGVFFPLILFVPGVPGQIFGDLAWTVIMANIISLLTSITLVPMLAPFVKIKKKEKRFESEHTASNSSSPPRQPRGAGEPSGRPPLEQPARKRGSGSPIKAFGDGPWRLIAFILGVATVLFLLSFMLFFKLDREVLPKVDQGAFLIDVELPIGSRLEITDASVRMLEEEIKRIPDVEHVAVTVGSSREEGAAGAVVVETRGSHQAQVLVALKEERKRSSADVVNELRGALGKKDLGSATVNFVLQESEFQAVGGGAKPIQIEVQGYDLETLKKLVGDTKAALRKIPGVFNVSDDQASPSPETKIDIDKRKAALFGISALDIAMTARTAIDGDVASKFRKGGQEIDIRVRLRQEDRQNLERIGNLLVHSEPFEIEVPIKEMAALSLGTSPSEIRHRDQQRTILVGADILPDFVKKDVMDQVAAAVPAVSLPEGFRIRLAGEAKEIQESFSRVFFALILSVILVYMIMASQFESFLHPFVIMFTVPLSLIGVSIALFISGHTLNIISLLGIIMLGGVVVSNGIVLIEYINTSRHDGLSILDACVAAVRTRARPILMSALSSVVGLIPMAMGLEKGSELEAPLAVAVMGGLISSTFLTLFVIPSLYIVFEKAMGRVMRRKVV